MNNKRETLKKIASICAVATIVPSSWIKPVINSVILPVHAQTSTCLGEAFSLAINFTGVDCNDPSLCVGLTDQEIIDSMIKPGQSEIFCISESEIMDRDFRRDIDLGGGGPAADYIIVTYIIETLNETQAAGTVTSSNVDSLITLTGEWTATIVQ